MRTYNTLDEMKKDPLCPPLVFLETQAFVLNCREEYLTEEEDETFTYLAGGTINVVEKLEDLQNIMTLEENKDTGKWASLFEAASSFDIANYIDEEKTLAVFWMATNNSGGTSWYIPKEFFTENVLKSIALTNSENNVYSVYKERENRNANNT